MLSCSAFKLYVKKSSLSPITFKPGSKIVKFPSECFKGSKFKLNTLLPLVAFCGYTALPGVMRYNKNRLKNTLMKAYSVDLRTKIVVAHQDQKLSIRKTAAIFSVSKSLVQKLVKQQKIEGNLQPKPRGETEIQSFE